jgi:hypothetical protein
MGGIVAGDIIGIVEDNPRIPEELLNVRWKVLIVVLGELRGWCG